MAEIKLTDPTIPFLETLPDNALIYVVVPGAVNESKKIRKDKLFELVQNSIKPSYSDVLKNGGRAIRSNFGTTEEIHEYDLIKENRSEILVYVNYDPELKLDRFKLNAGQFDPGDTLEIFLAGNAGNDVILKTDSNTVLSSGSNYLPGGEITLKIGKFYTFLFVGIDGENEIWIDISVGGLQQTIDAGPTYTYIDEEGTATQLLFFAEGIEMYGGGKSFILEKRYIRVKNANYILGFSNQNEKPFIHLTKIGGYGGGLSLDFGERESDEDDLNKVFTIPFSNDIAAGRNWCLENLTSTVSGASVADISARDAYDVPAIPFTIFVVNDGDGKWALYMATSTGVGASFVKISDPDLLNAQMTPAAIKASYESNANTNAFTNAYKAAIDNLSNNFQTKGVYEEYFIFNTTPTSPVTGVTSQTIYYAEKIKAGTLKVGSQFTVEFQALKTGAAGNASFNFYIGNSPTDLTYSRIVGSFTRLTTHNTQSFSRTCQVISATKIRILQWNLSAANDKNATASVWEDRDFDISSDQWVISTGALGNADDSMFGNFLTVKGVR